MMLGCSREVLVLHGSNVRLFKDKFFPFILFFPFVFCDRMLVLASLGQGPWLFEEHLFGYITKRLGCDFCLHLFVVVCFFNFFFLYFRQISYPLFMYLFCLFP